MNAVWRSSHKEPEIEICQLFFFYLKSPVALIQAPMIPMTRMTEKLHQSISVKANIHNRSLTAFLRALVYVL